MENRKRVELEIIKESDHRVKIILSGAFDKEHIKSIYSKLKRVKQDEFDFVLIECEGVEKLDFAGALVLSELTAFFAKKGASIVVKNLQNEFKELLFFARKNLREKPPVSRSGENFIISYLNSVGAWIFSQIGSFFLFLSFLGESVVTFFRVLANPLTFRYRATAVQIERSGAKSLPIVALTSFLVGLVIAYQSAEQLAKFGANIFIVDMVCISVFRELAPLIAAIVIAGRSASSFTAEIGTMKITEEIDAMRTQGFDPMLFIVMPRVIALVLSMPLIVFFADMVGVFGGMIVADGYLNVSYKEFIIRARDAIEIKHILIGLFKAPFFGLLIALIGCFRGFQVTGSTESIGRYTTISVVNAIFWVIACNALISVVLTEIGI